MTSANDDLKRLSEIRDYAIKLNSPKAYFKSGDDKFSNPIKRPYFVELERKLQGLDAQAWTHLKAEIFNRLKQWDSLRGWQPLADILNEARGYNYLESIGCMNIRFIPRSAAKTPDLQAMRGNLKILCDVKTINISQDEAERRANGGVGATKIHLSDQFFNKLLSDIETASSQMHAFNASEGVHRLVYIVVNFDDPLHEYADDYRSEIEAYLKTIRKPDTEVVLDITSTFSNARWSSVKLG